MGQPRLTLTHSVLKFAITAFEISLRLLLYLITGALERSTFSSSGIDSKDSSFWSREGEDKLRHGLILRLSLQHPPTLWARSEGSNVSIEGLHCTLRADLHHDKIYIYIQRKKHFTENSTWHLSTLLTSGNSTTCISLNQCQPQVSLRNDCLDLPEGEIWSIYWQTFPFMQFFVLLQQVIQLIMQFMNQKESLKRTAQV